ncbi:MAG: site-specific DNA-methyltransferase [Candidatus Accumulibacter sp.]|uniref:site-specific DNA-methyltransferase (adenine-specific) n=1 Tax=Candidatus Accumulibacter affinis TaxID=2954384 RepID=A0A935THC4_9PROT|nr:site-specific DNA-methyltransferase [Candidatus Accumulibacter affinis]
MQPLAAGSPESQSADLKAENIATLKALFPELLSERIVDGKPETAINVDVLKQLVGDTTASDAEEKYGLNWHGKRRARQIALTPSTGTLRPCPDESVDWDTTQNLMIEGDNLEVLKLLQKSYAGKVKLIYIDPPYNTGKDFVYPDNFQDNIKNYLELTGQVESGRKVSSNTEASGRFHTDWLNMMYPRIKLARNLLKDDGVVFISCDDNEVQNLRALMDDVFGGENFVASIIWQKVYSPKNSARHFSEDHDYIVVYARDAGTWTPRLLPRTEEMEARYGNPDNDPRGPWKPGDLSARNYYGEGTYAITCPSGRVIEGPPPGNYWRVSQAKFGEMDRDGRIWWGHDGNNVPAIKRFLSEVKAGRVPQTLWTYQEVGHTQEAKKELISLVDFPNSDVVFDTPKPTRLIRRILQLTTVPGEASDPDNFVGVRDMSADYVIASNAQRLQRPPPEIVLDFFAGTGSTMDAVFRQNAEDHGNRRCILVQLPEPLDGTGGSLKTIADIAKERLRRAGQKIKTEHPQISQMGADKGGDLFASHLRKSASSAENTDLGFRVFKLDPSNIRAWSPDRDDLAGTLLANIEHIQPDRSDTDVLYELLLKLGLDLCVPIEARPIAGKTVHSIVGGVLMACLEPRIAVSEAEALALGMAAWRKEQAPAGDTTAVFRDSAFENDVAKSNLAAILQQHGIGQVRSL